MARMVSLAMESYEFSCLLRKGDVVVMTEQEQIAWHRERYEMLKDRSRQLLDERNALKQEIEWMQLSFTVFYNHYCKKVSLIEDGEAKADLIELIGNQAETIRRYQMTFREE